MNMVAALTACTFLGLQHGVDWDHVAAISDVTSVQATSREATLCGLNYAAGHAATVGILGIAVITLRSSVPESFANWMQRLVGFTLVLLGVYVIRSLLAGGEAKSRGQLILALFDRLHWPHKQMPGSIAGRYGRKSSLSLGILHGIGAETPTQLSMLVITTSLGGLQNGVLGLAVFTTAMFASNIALTTAVTTVFSISKARPVAFRWLGVFTAGYSLWIGFMLLTA
jgi:high-affinity nickel-transport protein